MGDYDDLSSTSERPVFASAMLHNTTRTSLEKMYRQYTERLAKELSFMKGKLLGLLEGNHYSVFEDGTTTTQYLCQLLECKYLGVSAFIRLRFCYKPSDTSTMSLDIWAHHGSGASGGRTVGGSKMPLRK